jgi:hypothetical protein
MSGFLLNSYILASSASSLDINALKHYVIAKLQDQLEVNAVKHYVIVKPTP